ncbi:hypothetical protein MTR_3g056565 [Medicago truncatula]|nr:hypothetical protein MTR_3g056565 [Medicago truncatula]
MDGGFGYTNQRKMKETKSSPSMDESMNIITLKCHGERVSVVRVAGIESIFRREFFSCPFSKDHKYNLFFFFVWVDEAEALGLLNGTLDQDVYKAGLLRKKDNLKKRNACNYWQNCSDIWKLHLMEKIQILKSR